MNDLNRRFDIVDVRITNWMARHCLPLLRIGLGIVFFWFGALKFFPGLSPAQELAARTIQTLTFGRGQYIIKNAVLISAAIVLGATARGGRLVAQP